MNHLTRRHLLGSTAALLATAACGGGSSAGQVVAPLAPEPAPSPSPSPSPSPTATPPAEGLNALAEPRRLRFGSAFAWGPSGADRGSFANPAYAALLERDCGILVPENEMKWQALRPSADRFDFERFDAMIAYAGAKGFAMRGHTLLWHHPRWFPDWLNNHDFGASPAAEAERILTGHIRAVARRYAGKIASYDVVNEAVDPDSAGLRETSLSRAMGGAEAVLDLAFRIARAEAPGAQLVYNDYMSWEAGNAQHRAGVLKLLEGFKARGVPVDALGVQSHIGVFEPTDAPGALAATFEPEWRRFLDAVTAMGYDLIITEFDVRDRGLSADIAVRDRGVADYARAYLDVMLSYPQLRDVLVWGMSDRYSWLRTFEPRPDGEITRGCPYDIEMRPKPLYDAIGQALAAAPMRGNGEGA